MKQPMKTTALIVDDDPSVLFSLTNVLSSEEFVVFHATNGQEALERVKNHPEIGVVLLDLNMPRKNGWETFHEIRLALPLVPVIIVTADPSRCGDVLAAGAAALLEKPLDIPRLLETITQLLAEERPERLSRLRCSVAAAIAETAAA